MKPTIYRVLLVEDSAGDARLIREMLAETPNPAFELAPTAVSLAEARRELAAGGIDLILLDLSLPDSHGIETFNTLRQSVPALPIIILSGLNDEELALKTVHAGAQDYLVKGTIDSHVLLRSMRYAIERARTEHDLAHERELLRSVIDNLPDSIYVKDIGGHYLLDNRAHRQSLGSAGEGGVEGKTVEDFFPPEVAARFAADDHAVLHSGEPLLDKVEPSVGVDGTRTWLSTAKVPVRDEAGQIWGLVCIGREITEKKLAEEKLLALNADLARSREELLKTLDDLRQAHQELQDVQLQLIEAEKMKSIGRLAAGVAHEVKNPLATLTMGLAYLKQLPPTGDDSIPMVLDDMSDAVNRADGVIRGLLDFSVPKKLEVAPENLNTVIERALLLVRGEMGGSGGIEVLRELAPGLPEIQLDRIKIGQVFINLFTNAIHAMPEGGKLTVRTFLRQPATADAQENGTCVIAEVDDTGTGIPADKLQNIFEPFFTTKPTGKGTGLGLTVTRTIVDLHHGKIEVCNLPDRGARFTVAFKA